VLTTSCNLPGLFVWSADVHVNCISEQTFSAMNSNSLGQGPQRSFKDLWRFLARNFFKTRGPSCHPTNSVKAMKEQQWHN